MNRKTILLSALLLPGLLLFGVMSLRGYAQEVKRDIRQIRRDTQQIRRDTQQIQRDTFIVHFPFNRYDTTAGDEEKISRSLLGAVLKGFSIDSVAVTGHTDQTGPVGYNLELSLQRARFVAGYLNKVFPLIFGNDPGFSGNRLRMYARGKAEPISVIDSLNRRVVVVFRYRVADSAVARPSTDTAKLSPAVDTGKPITDTPNAKPVIDTIVTLANIFFVGNSPELTPSSRMALPSTISSLRTYIHRTIRILGNCNSPGPILKKDHPLYVLSVKRAKVIYEYLIKEGFDPQKLSFVGLGNTAMKNPHPTTRAQMEENMRVDVEVYKQ